MTRPNFLRDQRRAAGRNGNRTATDRERAVVRLLEEDGWIAFRAPASLGCADVIAMKACDELEYNEWEGDPIIWCEPIGDAIRFGKLLIEVKSTTRSPWVAYPPAKRAELLAAAEKAGATALLCWWPVRSKPQWLEPSTWPTKGQTQ